VLKVEDSAGAPILNVFGARSPPTVAGLESALKKIQPYFANVAKPWTGGCGLARRDFPVEAWPLKQELHDRYGCF